MSESDPNHTIIEENQQFSQSLIWQLQRKFFAQQGIHAWRDGIVPHYITSNAYMARSYASVVFGWLRDVAVTLDSSQPIYLVELGAGSGRFAYHFMQSFFDRLDQSALRDIQVTYVLTEFTQTTIDFWMSHDQLKPFVEAGRLDFAKFDAEHDDSLMLIYRGEQVSSSTLKNPMAVMANYFFDGLPQDLFWVEDGKLFESLATLTVPQSNPDLDDPDLLKSIDIIFQHRPINTDYYEDARWNDLLDSYRTTLDDTNVLLPVVGFACLQRLLKLSNGRLFLMTGDKGFHREEDLLAFDYDGLTIHGSFSIVVNYHALGQLVETLGGRFLSVPYQHANLDICVAVFGDRTDETADAYEQEIVRRNPDDFHHIKSKIDHLKRPLSVKQFLSYLRLSNWDERTFSQYASVLLEQAGNIPADLADELYREILKVWTMYYHIGEKNDLAFNIGNILYGLEFYSEAIAFFNHSLRLYGDYASTLCNIALCYDSLNQPDTALTFVQQALALDAEFKLAQELQVELEGKIDHGS